MDREKGEIYEDFVNRRNLERHLKKPYWRASLRLLWFNEVARKVSKEYGIDLKVEIDETRRVSDWRAFIVSKFNGGNMDEEKKLEEIKKRAEALIVARRVAHQVYGPIYSWKHRREYLEFCDALLARFGLKKMKSSKGAT